MVTGRQTAEGRGDGTMKNKLSKDEEEFRGKDERNVRHREGEESGTGARWQCWGKEKHIES